MARRSILLMIAVLIAALGTALIVLYVRGIEDRERGELEMVRVLVATDTIDAGETVEQARESGKLETREVSEGARVPEAVADSASLAGRVALAPIYEGEQLTTTRFGDPSAARNIQVPDDKMAVAVELTDPARIGGNLTVGSEVAIFVSGDPKLIKPDGEEQQLDTTTRIVIPRVTVIGIGGTTDSAESTVDESAADQEAAEVSTAIVTVAVDQEEAERLIFSARNGDVSFALIGDDYEPEDNTGVTPRSVFPEAFPS